MSLKTEFKHNIFRLVVGPDSNPWIMRPLGNVHDNIFYTEKAELWCRRPISGTERKMAPWGAVKTNGAL